MAEKPLVNAKDILSKGEFAFALTDGFAVHTSDKQSAEPLLVLVDAGIDCAGYHVAAKSIGLSEAFLLVNLRVGDVEANRISSEALSVLQAHAIKAKYEALEESIVDSHLPQGAINSKTPPGQALLLIRAAYHPKRS